MASAQTIDTNIKILSKIADNTRLTMNVVSDFKNSVSSQMNAVTNGLSNLGKSLSQTFSLSSIGSKIGETFNKGFNSFTAPFKTLSSHISAAFTGLKMKLANLNPVEAVKEKIRNITQKPVAAVKTLFGKNDEQVKRKFFSVWSDPKKVAKIWNKEANVNKNMSAAGIKKSADISGIGNAMLGVVNKFFNMANKFITKLLTKTVAAFHSAIGPYVFLIIGAITLLALLFKDEIKQIVPVFGKVLNTAIDIFDMIKGPIGMMLTNLINIFSSLYEVINNVISGVLGGIANTLSGIFSFTTRIIDTINKSFDMVNDFVFSLLTPIRDTILALQPVFNGMVDLLRNFIKNPIGTAVEVGKSIVGGFKSFIGGIFGSNTKDENESGSILENLFNKIGNTITDIKNYLLGEFIDNLKSSFNYFIDKIQTSKMFIIIEKSFNKLFNFYDELIGIIHSIQNTIGSVEDKIGSLFSGAGNIAKNVFNGISTVATGFKYKLSSLFNVGTTTKEETKQNNPFNEVIRGFEKMHADTIKILSSIKAAVISIEKNKIEIGNSLAQNNARASDGKKMNNLQNITMNYQVDINQVVEKMNETNKLLTGILTNTSMNEQGEQKASAVWSI